jgi:2-C-methyl-D-erythritol 2,4-cyclodiphosphate synthase
VKIRVGQGFDVHRFAADGDDRALVLGGVTFEGERGLVGHSDADAVAHAISDALLGAAGLGDLGMHFPDTDAKWKGVASTEILTRVVEMVRAAGWTIGNVDCNIVTESPKIAPRREEMQGKMTAIVGAPVSIKGRRAEQMGALGRREGLMCLAVAIVSAP